jgi:hypothetical protein
VSPWTWLLIAAVALFGPTLLLAFVAAVWIYRREVRYPPPEGSAADHLQLQLDLGTPLSPELLAERGMP